MATPGLRWLTRLFLLWLVCGAFVRAVDEFDDEGVDDVEEDLDEGAAEEGSESTVSEAVLRLVFPSQPEGGPLAVHAGTKTDLFATLFILPESPVRQLFVIAASLQQISNPANFIQNFSGVRTPRSVPGGSSATVHYSFTPDPTLEPTDYLLVVRMYLVNDDKESFLTLAQNTTIRILDPTGVDPHSIFALVLFVVVLVAVLFIAARRLLRGRRSRRRAPAASKTDEFDEAYVGKEHLVYREAVLRERSQRSGKSASPTRAEIKAKMS